MKPITIIEKDKVGLLMDISYVLGKEKLNIENIVASKVGDRAIISLVIKDREKAVEVLKRNGFNVIEGNLIIVKLEDKPGQLFEVSKILSDDNINMKNLYVISKDNNHTLVAIEVEKDKVKQARKLLEKYLIE